MGNTCSTDDKTSDFNVPKGLLISHRHREEDQANKIIHEDITENPYVTPRKLGTRKYTSSDMK